ncbi:MAG: hypothetical protein V2A54_16600 [Bacteroidota bacterium]
MVFLVIFVCSNICAGNVHAAWSSDPTVNNAICTEANEQQHPSIISDGSGGSIITWMDFRNGNSDIYAQRINASGVVQWTADGVAICTEPHDQNINTDKTDNKSIIVSDGSGGAIITWDDGRSGAFGIYAQRINSSGAVQWTANGVAVSTALNNQYLPKITSDGSSGAIITWYDDRNVNWDIYAQRINANGTLPQAAPSVATPVPTLNEWGMIIFMIAAGVASLYYLKYRKET